MGFRGVLSIGLRGFQGNNIPLRHSGFDVPLDSLDYEGSAS